MKLVKQARKYGRNVVGVVGGFALAVGVSVANAASTIDISPATTQATSDVNIAGGLVLSVIVAATVFTWLRRVIK
ncbi:major capsid protein [Paraherbaspirillum soli]|uniref:Major capsid protein n=1 Tax=Paraherbaspirillum soli TaxID=631222 RepID=A0ABW0MG56_9BURK